MLKISSSAANFGTLSYLKKFLVMQKVALKDSKIRLDFFENNFSIYQKMPI